MQKQLPDSDFLDASNDATQIYFVAYLVRKTLVIKDHRNDTNITEIELSRTRGLGPKQSRPTSSDQNVLIEFYSDSVARHLVIQISHCKKSSYLHELYIETRKNVNN